MITVYGIPFPGYVVSAFDFQQCKPHVANETIDSITTGFILDAMDFNTAGSGIVIVVSAISTSVFNTISS